MGLVEKCQRWLRVLKFTISRWFRPRPRFNDPLLVQNALLTPKQLRQCHGSPFDKTWTRLDVGDERLAARLRAQELGMPFVDVERVICDQSALNSVPSKMARVHQVLPVKRQDITLWVAFARPNDIRAMEALTQASGCRIIPVLATADKLAAAIERYYKVD